MRRMNKGLGARLRRRYHVLQTARRQPQSTDGGLGLQEHAGLPFRLRPGPENLERVKAGLRVQGLACVTTWNARSGMVYRQRRHFRRSDGPHPEVPPSGADPLGVGRLTGSRWDGPTLDFEARKTWIAVSEYTGALHVAQWEGEPFLGYGESDYVSVPSSIWLTGDLRIFALTDKSIFPGVETDFHVALSTGEVYNAWLMRPKPLDEFSWSDWQELEKTMRARVDYVGASISGSSVVLTKLGIQAGLGDE
jgi:hypothetical protein